MANAARPPSTSPPLLRAMVRAFERSTFFMELLILLGSIPRLDSTPLRPPCFGRSDTGIAS
jgi:hypothetical protein